MDANVPGPLIAAAQEEPVIDVEAALGDPVAVISGVKIYESDVLTQLVPFIPGENKRRLKNLFRYVKQPTNELTRIFIRQPLNFINKVREANIKTDGLFPPLELAVSTLVTAFRLLHDGFFSRALQDITILGFYITIINSVFPTRNLTIDTLVMPSHYILAIQQSPQYEDDRELLKQVADMIKLTYAGLGYDFSYFGFVKRDHPLRMAKMGKVPLKPNTFEAFGLFKFAPEEYLKAAAGLNGRNFEGRISCFRGVDIDIPRMAGWRKQDLVNAIKRSGLWKDVSGLKRITYTTDPEVRRMGIAMSDLGLTPSHNGQEVVRGLGRLLYFPLCYYEALYRRVYQTTDYIDWPLLCEVGAVSAKTIGKVAVDLYQATGAQIANASAAEICAFVTETARKRQQVTRTLALATQAAREGFVGQPGSRWIQPSTMQRRGPLGEVISQPANDYLLYQSVKQYCQNEQITKEQLVSYTTALNIRSYLPDNVDQYSKGDLCEYLVDFLLPRAQRYDHVLIDCADPAIGVRQILNAATIMELGGIFPKDVSKLSKSQACEIITNYIKLLREGVDLNLARQPRKVSD